MLYYKFWKALDQVNSTSQHKHRNKKKVSQNFSGSLKQMTSPNKTHIKRFNEEMLHIKELIEHVAFEALISGVKRRDL